MKRDVNGEGQEAAVQTSAHAPAARRVVCVRPGLTVVAGEAGRSFAPGDVVTLDAELAPGLTWAAAIGGHVHDYFAPVADGAGA